MSGARQEFNRILNKASKEAYKIVQKEVLDVLPKGWTLHFAVGWGLTLYDENSNCIIGKYTDPPANMPKGVRKAVELAADWCDTFGYDNSHIEGVRE